MVFVSPEIPPPRHPFEPAVLNTSNLESLSTRHEENRVQEFIASQTRYAKAQANEGRAVRASWDISTPEKVKMSLHQQSAGFETPVLKPRAAEIIRAEPNNRPASRPQSNSSANKPTPPSPELVKKGKAKATSATIREGVPPKRQKRPENKPTRTTKKSGTSNPPARKERRARSDTDEEHLASMSFFFWLTERRERKRARREIMNPREVKASTRDEKENKDGAKSGPGASDKKKQKLPVGLALMHGFSSTSVGKNRLTIEPPPNFGVFNKGRASAKINVDESKHMKQRGFPSRIFSEDRFLSSRLPKLKSPEKPLRNSETSSRGNTGNDQSSSPVRKKRSTAVKLRKTPIRIKGSIERYLPAASPKCDNEMANIHASRADSDSGTKPNDDLGVASMKSRSPVRSASWVIEQDNISLPSTTSDVAIASVKSKPETALLDIRAAAWSRILKSDLHKEKAPFPPAEHGEDPHISTLPVTTTAPAATSNAHVEFEELATIGPWESASQIARSTMYPQEQGSVHSRYFALPHSREDGFTQPETHLANDSLGQLSGVHGAHPNSDGDRNTNIDEHLVYGEASVDHQDDLLRVTPPANAPRAEKAFTSPEEHVSILQTSLDSVDRALLLDLPGVTYRRSGNRRRSMQWREFKSTPENRLFHQYGLDPTDNHCDGLRPFLHGHDSEPADASKPLGSLVALGSMQDSGAQSFGGEYYAEELEGNREEQGGRSEYFPPAISESPVFASDDIAPNASHDCQNEGQLFIDEDTDYERVIEREEGCTSLGLSSILSADWSAFLEGEGDRETKIHLWSEEAWPRGKAVGETTLQEGCSHMTTVQKVEQDVAKKLKGHWFPHKF